MDTNWWQCADVRKKLQTFHERCAREPDTVEAKSIHTEITKAIYKQLKSQKYVIRVDYAGSAYEGVQIGPEVEFDVMFIMDGSKLEKTPTSSHEHFYLRALPDFTWGLDNNFEKFIDPSSRQLDTDKVKNVFKGVLAKILNSMPSPNRVKLLDHGPAVQLDIYAPPSYECIYNMDVVPCFEINGEQFVAKPVRKPHNNVPDVKYFWRRSFSREETEFFKSRDHGNGCRKKIVRIFKALKLKETALKKISSYHLKTAMMKLCKQNNEKEYWRENNIVPRMMELFGYLQSCAAEGRMPHFYFGEKVNLFDHISPRALENAANRIKRITERKNVFLKAINS